MSDERDLTAFREMKEFCRYCNTDFQMAVGDGKSMDPNIGDVLKINVIYFGEENNLV